ncbi:hypothetical protein E2C01_033057 [Portunus trituberculatus]|uniref:Uncharacterized protein n=1 Tax=Portunus trituberculatus TaxID=210409 RepID=A0A5B7EWU6_PORTR|nr:hypothetical protein [Portunus trituberculatus]
MVKLPSDLYRRVSRQIQGILDEVLDEVDRREGQQQRSQPLLPPTRQYFAEPQCQHSQYQPPHHQPPQHHQFTTFRPPSQVAS